ncbi:MULTISPECIES: membrane or secreted protein [Croceitalea]|uniref:Membrane or secreted protein n=1 Tax=Croceitalea vernalis TaxID=3075599 RepID=A0ABU3BDJ8_9FLAO|nr:MULTISPECIES: membrane or secreted protein [unclassified Croceitalea]MDT0538502.1 membrane or secreted protein [Croceitalea sp. P059]MDT0620280.1 membrane or secreted protein [Croceitalea sp. P007]
MVKKALFVSFCLLASAFLNAQSLIGAWEATGDFGGKNIRSVVIFSSNHQVGTFYDAESGAFVGTNGGTWSLEGTTLSETVEFDTENPERVGSTSSFEIELSTDELKIKDAPMVWKRVDNGSPGALAGAWLMSGRKRDGEIQSRDTSRPRKTMKILSGTRFQWIAYNTETKQFMGTGGGNYTTIDGKYTENIEFFSRDDSRVGASLEFNFELKEGDWHHSGFSSKGAPLYEIWSLRKE